MKAVILAGGLGSRLGEDLPKPMVEIGGKPIIRHVMGLYAAHGVRDFVICCGHKGAVLRDHFAASGSRSLEQTVEWRRDEPAPGAPWRVTLVDTGQSTMTGGRLKRVRHLLGDGPACVTYADGVSDVDLTGLIAFHLRHGLRATVTAVHPPPRFGTLQIEGGDRVSAFGEKTDGADRWINGGFFVIDPRVLDGIEGDGSVWEGAPLEGLARSGQLAAFRHDGFWLPMDTPRDRQLLEELWASGRAPWSHSRSTAGDTSQLREVG